MFSKAFLRALPSYLEPWIPINGFFFSKVHSKIKKLKQNKKYIDFFTIAFCSHSTCGVDQAFISSHLNVLMASYVT